MTVNMNEPYRKQIFPSRSRLNTQGRKSSRDKTPTWRIDDLLQTTFSVMQWDGDIRINFLSLNRERECEVVLARHDARNFYEALGEALKDTTSRP